VIGAALSQRWPLKIWQRCINDYDRTARGLAAKPTGSSRTTMLKQLWLRSREAKSGSLSEWSLGNLVHQGRLGARLDRRRAVSGAENDSIQVWVNNSPYKASGNDYFPDLRNQWQESEFNVFGDGGGDQAVFNSGATVVVRTGVDSGTTSGPGCDNATFTGESNNLTLVNVPPNASKGPMPALVFSERNPAPAGAAATCMDSIAFVQGDRIGGGEPSAASNCPSGTFVTGIEYWNGDSTSALRWVPSHRLHCQDANGNPSLGNQIGGGEPAGYLTCTAGSYVIGISYWNGDSKLRITAIPNHQLVCDNPSTNVISSSTQAGGGEWVTNLSCPPGTYLIGIQFWDGDTVSPAPDFMWPWGIAYVPNHELECR